MIGLAAPVLVLAGRLLQGFSAGVELGSVSVYLSEIAPLGKKGFYVSWQSGSQQVAVITAALVGVATEKLVSPAAMGAWGWRHTAPDGLSDRPAALPAAPPSSRDRGLQEGSGSPPGRSDASDRAGLARRAGRHDARGDDDGELLHHHRLHPDLWRARAAPVGHGGAGRDPVRGGIEPDLAADHGRDVGQDRPAAAPDRLHRGRPGPPPTRPWCG